jgi:hypothetical protein
MQSRPRSLSQERRDASTGWKADRPGSRGQMLGEEEEEEEERDWVGTRTRASELVIESRGHGEMRSAEVRARRRRRRRRRNARRDGHGTTTSTKLPGCFGAGPGRTPGGRARISAGPTYRGFSWGSGGRLPTGQYGFFSRTRKRTRAGPGALMTCRGIPVVT